MSKMVMVVDDSFMVRQQVGKALKGAGFEVVEAGDGQDALEKLGVNPGVALVVCDVNMPRMSGIEFLERLREDQSQAALPVVMLTTEGQNDIIQRAKALGAKGWITKPFKADLLIAAAKKLAGVAA